MRLSTRLAVAVFVIVTVLLVKTHLGELRNAWQQYGVSVHGDDKQPLVNANPSTSTVASTESTIVPPPSAESTQPPPQTSTESGQPISQTAEAHPDENGSKASTPERPDKVIVMAKMEKEDTEWVHENLPDWQHAIYTVDNPNATLHTPANKGKESMAYLTYIIEHYDELPSIVAFIHSHRDGFPKAWHTDADNYDNVASLKALNLSFVQRTGYANLRCIHIPGCPNEIQPFRATPSENEIAENAMPNVWRVFFNSTEVPSTLATPCCGQFAVSRDQILARPLEDYMRYRQWILQTNLTDAWSGRVLEYLWHVIFGRDPIYCPDYGQCRCDVYGQC